jgi:hypothetical protein
MRIFEAHPLQAVRLLLGSLLTFKLDAVLLFLPLARLAEAVAIA